MMSFLCHQLKMVWYFQRRFLTINPSSYASNKGSVCVNLPIVHKSCMTKLETKCLEFFVFGPNRMWLLWGRKTSPPPAMCRWTWRHVTFWQRHWGPTAWWASQLAKRPLRGSNWQYLGLSRVQPWTITSGYIVWTTLRMHLR